MSDTVTPSRELMSRAAELLEDALDLLDEAKAPGHIGAHVDLALCQIRDRLEQTEGTGLERPAAFPSPDIPAI
jgi:hypothetical protein